MRSKVFFVALAVVSLVAIAANAAPIVTMSASEIGGYKALDFFYTASDGAEFTNYHIDVQTDNGLKIQDPDKNATADAGGDAVDTFANTVYSFLDFGPASYVFDAYKPSGVIPPQNPPVNHLSWEVYDTNTGDTNDPFGDGSVVAPWHLARVLLDLDATGTWQFDAVDTLSGGTPTVFGDAIPGLGGEPPVADDALYDFTAGGPTDVSHQFTATGGATPYSWSDLTLQSSPGVGNTASMGSDGLFSWDRNGAAAGTWVWTALVTDDGGLTDTGELTVIVPEPASLALFGLAMVGLVGYIRRS